MARVYQELERWQLSVERGRNREREREMERQRKKRGKHLKRR